MCSPLQDAWVNTGAALGGFQEPQPHQLSRIHSSHPRKMAGKSIPYKVKLMPLHSATVWKHEVGGWTLQAPRRDFLTNVVQTLVHAQWESNGISDLMAVK